MTFSTPNRTRPLLNWRDRVIRRTIRNMDRAEAMYHEVPGDDPAVDRLRRARFIEMDVAIHDEAWRDCVERACRRARCCLAPHIQCSNPPPDDGNDEDEPMA